MNMKRTLALVLTIAICATMALGGTLAYLTDTEEAVNVMTVGRVDIELIEQQRNEDRSALEDFEDGKQLLPIVGSAQGDKDEWGMSTAKNYVDKIVNVENIGNTAAYVRVIVGVPSALEESLGAAAQNALHWNVGNRFAPDHNYDGNVNEGYADISWKGVGTTNVDGIEYNVYAFTYKNALQPKNTTAAAAFVGFYLDENVDWDDETGKYYLGEKIAANEIEYDLSKGVKIPVMAQAVQADGFASADEAFAAAKLPEIPWDNNSSFATPAVVGTVEALNKAIEAEQDIILDDDLTVEEQIVLKGSNLDGANNVIYSNVGPDARGNSVPAVLATEGLVENLSVYGAGRGVGTRDALTGDLTLRNIHTDGGSYALNVGLGNGHNLLVENSFLYGWVSFGTGFKSVIFNNVQFGKGGSGAKTIRPWQNATFANCDFTGVEIDLEDSTLSNITEIKLTGCKIGDTMITKDNVAELLLTEDDEASKFVIE